MEAGTVAVRQRGNKGQEVVSVESFMTRLQKEITDKFDPKVSV
jgi:threonyl-tRNA synthetase